jgi:hypothetical protein
MQNRTHARIVDVVINAQPIFAHSDQSGAPETGKLLRNVSLAFARCSGEMADASSSAPSECKSESRIGCAARNSGRA